MQIIRFDVLVATVFVICMSSGEAYAQASNSEGELITAPVIDGAFRGMITYSGSYNGSAVLANQPRLPVPQANLNIGGLHFNVPTDLTQSRPQMKQIQGAITWDLMFDRGQVSGRYTTNGDLHPGSVRGQVVNGYCTLYDDVGGAPWSGPCDNQSFRGSNPSTRPGALAFETVARRVVSQAKIEPQTLNGRTPQISQSSNTSNYNTSSNAIQSKASYSGMPFFGLDTWQQTFGKACHQPADFSKIREDIVRRANSIDAKGYSLVNPGRNNWQKFQTDYQLYILYDRDPCSLERKASQCTVPRSYSAQEACDCVSGFPGDVAFGPGAGELVVGSNTKIGIQACSVAFNETPPGLLKARYLAQQARAQANTLDTRNAITWATQAVSMGYKRAEIVMAVDAVHEVEMLSGGFPGITVDRANNILGKGLEHLRAAKTSGVREVRIVSQSYEQAIDSLNFNISFANEFIRMAKPDPKTPNDNLQFEQAWRYNNRMAGTCSGNSC